MSSTNDKSHKRHVSFVIQLQTGIFLQGHAMKTTQ